jgi:hypothetical protein
MLAVVNTPFFHRVIPRKTNASFRKQDIPVRIENIGIRLREPAGNSGDRDALE